MKIIPTVFSHNKKEFTIRLEKLLPISSSLQVDFMDGKFVKAKSITLAQVPDLKNYEKHFEAHLMTYNPERYLLKLKEKGFKKIIFHFSATKNPGKTIDKISKMDLAPWIALNPKTRINQVIPYLRKVRGVLIMGVNPGKEKQALLPSTFSKIKEIRSKHPSIPIQIDGGVNEKTAKKLAKAGATILNTGSFVTEAENPKEALRFLRGISA